MKAIKIRVAGISDEVKALPDDLFRKVLSRSLTPDEVEHYANLYGKSPTSTAPDQPVVYKTKGKAVSDTMTDSAQ